MALTFEEYQQACVRTSGMSGADPLDNVTICALGITGEAGEVADIVKKVLNQGLLPASAHLKIIEELGDVLYYCAAMCSALGVQMAHVAAQNTAKLQKRYPNGFYKRGGG